MVKKLTIFSVSALLLAVTFASVWSNSLPQEVAATPQICEESGGNWNGSACVCPVGQTPDVFNECLPPEGETCEQSGGDWSVTNQSCDCSANPTNTQLLSGACVEPGTVDEPSEFTVNIDDVEANCDTPGELTPENCRIIYYINVLINTLSAVVAIVVIGSIIYAGIEYSMAAGEQSKVEDAKKRIRWAIIAFLMYIFAYAFIDYLIPGGFLS